MQHRDWIAVQDGGPLHCEAHAKLDTAVRDAFVAKQGTIVHARDILARFGQVGSFNWRELMTLLLEIVVLYNRVLRSTLTLSSGRIVVKLLLHLKSCTKSHIVTYSPNLGKFD